MTGILPKFATNENYTTGPKAGSPTKVAPSALLPDGIQPGTGQRISAEEMNYLLSMIADNSRSEYLNRFSQLRDADISAIAASGIWEVATHPRTGIHYCTSDKSTTTLLELAPNGAASVKENMGSAGRAITACRNGAGEARILYTLLDGTIRYSTDADPEVFAAGSGSVPISAFQGASLAYDAVNESSIYVREASGVLSIRYIPDAATPTVTSPTTPPTSTSGFELVKVAAGGGRCLIVGSGAGNTYSAAISTDGGDIWADTAAAPTSISSSGASAYYLPAVKFVENFLGRGPRFVVVQTNDNNRAQVLSTVDGSSWTTEIDLDRSSASYTSGVPSSGAIYGSCVVLSDFTADGSTTVEVLDLLSGTLTAHSIEMGTATSAKVEDFGDRFVLAESGSSCDFVALSPIVGTPLTNLGTDI